MPNLRPRRASAKVETAEISSSSPSPPTSPKRTTKSSKTKAAQEKRAKAAPKSSTKKAEAPKKVEEEIKAEENDEFSFHELNEKEMKEINNAFDMNCSEDGEELLDSDSLKTAIRSMGYEPRADEIKKLLKKHSNRKGKVNRNGFQKIMAEKINSSPGVKDNMNDAISKVFNLLDLDRTGYITLENLKSISQELNEEITDEELQEMMTEADEDGDFKISKDEFCNIMKKTSLY